MTSTIAASPSTLTPTTTLSQVALAKVPSVRVFANPDDTASPARTLASPNKDGAQLVLLIEKTQGDWLFVDLPVLPNGSTGWVKTGDFSISQHDYRIVVDLTAHTIAVFKGSTIVLSEPVGVGVGTCASSGGKFYTTELVQPPTADTVYGAYAYVLSGSPDASAPVDGNIPMLGIHGNNDPSALGKDVAKGCVLMSNSGITTLAKTLPLGVPVDLRR